jgi:phospholipid/cholesterol/gamma-HCH transport system substrate-binding protein
LQVGNNVRFSGINVGTVDNIEIVNDSTVKVDMLIQKEVQKFIKRDCQVGIGSEGIIGDRILFITQGNSDNIVVKEGQKLNSLEPVETDAIIQNLKVTVENAEVVTDQLAEILYKINNGSGTLGRLIQDTTIAENIDKTIENLKKSSKGLNENMEAAKHNFLLKGYFKKKEKEAEKKKKETEEKKRDAQEEK